MPVTRSKKNQKVEADEHAGDKREHKAAAHGSDQPEAKSEKHEPNQKVEADEHAGDKREHKAAADDSDQPEAKSAKHEPNQKVEADEHAGDKREHKAAAHDSDQPEAKSAKHEPNQKAGRRGSKAETKKAKDDQTPSEEKVKNVDSLEKGHVYFFYRPKVDTGDDVESEDDVQKLYMILKPHWTRTGDRMPTLIILGRKKMPSVDNRAKYWGFVGAADNDISKLTEAFKESSYETKTQGTRKIHASRPVAEGVYMITTHNGHSHLAYITTAPKEPGTVQEAFNIDKEASLIISIKASLYLNPETSNPAGAGLRGNRKAEFPKELQESFRDRRFIAMETTQFLNYANCEILLIGATDNLIQELGEVGEELHDLEEEDEFKVQGSGVEDFIFDELKLEKNNVPIQPLHGEWK